MRCDNKEVTDDNGVTNELVICEMSVDEAAILYTLLTKVDTRDKIIREIREELEDVGIGVYPGLNIYSLDYQPVFLMDYTYEIPEEKEV